MNMSAGVQVEASVTRELVRKHVEHLEIVRKGAVQVYGSSIMNLKLTLTQAIDKLISHLGSTEGGNAHGSPAYNQRSSLLPADDAKRRQIEQDLRTFMVDMNEYQQQEEHKHLNVKMTAVLRAQSIVRIQKIIRWDPFFQL